MAKALLINPSYLRTYGSNEGGIAFPVYPILSLAALAGAIRERGHEVSILDLSYRPYRPELIRDVVRREKPDVVGITATTPLVNQLRDMSYVIKRESPSILVLGGGAHPSALPDQTMRQSALDAVAAGEQDYAIADLLDGRELARLPGVHWRSGDGQIHENPAAPLIEDLDRLPLPDWESYPRESNRWITKIIARHNPVTTIEFSRGCVFTCDFCGSKNTMGLGYRKKSPERCADEMERLESMGFREVVIVDDIFTSDTNWAASVCEAIIRRGTRIAWTCTNGIRVDAINDTLFQTMRAAGCYKVYFGFESGDDAVLEAFGKGGRATLEKGVEAVDLALAAGLEPNGFFQVGLSSDTGETMEKTIEYARSLRLASMKCGITVPFPGTPMFHQLAEQGRMKTFDWDDYNVYQNAEAIFDHPTVSWPDIRKAMRRFYVRAYFGNPAYLWRRAQSMVRTREIFWTLYYTVKFFLVLLPQRRRRAEDKGEEYAYRELWGQQDIRDGRSLASAPDPPAAKRPKLVPLGQPSRFADHGSGADRLPTASSPRESSMSLGSRSERSRSAAKTPDPTRALRTSGSPAPGDRPPTSGCCRR